MDTKILPITFQHVRAIATQNLGGQLNKNFKIITPFPPIGNDFGDFKLDDLEFNDTQLETEGAAKDSYNAYEFSLRTDKLYYNFSYGIISQDYYLSQVCKRFYGETMNINAVSSDFLNNYNEKKHNYLVRLQRQTVGNLGKIDFPYVSLSQISWNNKITILKNEIDKLKKEVILVYDEVRNADETFTKARIEEIKMLSYSKIEFDLGYFDVIRGWIDPQLFEDNSWKLNSGDSALYGENDPDFLNTDVRLCYAHRYYVIRKYIGHSIPIEYSDLKKFDDFIISVRDRRSTGIKPLNSAAADDKRTTTAGDKRIEKRNSFLSKNINHHKSENNKSTDNIIVKSLNFSDTSPSGYVWIPATSSVPGHYIRNRTSSKPEGNNPVSIDNMIKIAAVIGRVIPWKPNL